MRASPFGVNTKYLREWNPVATYVLVQITDIDSLLRAYQLTDDGTPTDNIVATIEVGPMLDVTIRFGQRCRQSIGKPVPFRRFNIETAHFFFCPVPGATGSARWVFVCAVGELEAPGCGLGFGRLMRNFTAPFSLPSEITASNSFGSGSG